MPAVRAQRRSLDGERVRPADAEHERAEHDSARAAEPGARARGSKAGPHPPPPARAGPARRSRAPCPRPTPSSSRRSPRRRTRGRRRTRARPTRAGWPPATTPRPPRRATVARSSPVATPLTGPTRKSRAGQMPPTCQKRIGRSRFPSESGPEPGACDRPSTNGTRRSSGISATPATSVAARTTGIRRPDRARPQARTRAGRRREPPHDSGDAQRAHEAHQRHRPRHARAQQPDAPPLLERRQRPRHERRERRGHRGRPDLLDPAPRTYPNSSAEHEPRPPPQRGPGGPAMSGCARTATAAASSPPSTARNGVHSQIRSMPVSRPVAASGRIEPTG